MTFCWRMASGLVLVLVMVGLPVAGVVCDLVCPQPTGRAAQPVAALSAQAGDSATAGAPCHDAVTAGGQAGRSSLPEPAVGLGAAAHHACEHPPVLSSPRAPEVLRVPEPSTTVRALSHHLSPLAPTRAVVPTLAGGRAAALPPGAPFSPVLRI